MGDLAINIAMELHNHTNTVKKEQRAVTDRRPCRMVMREVQAYNSIENTYLDWDIASIIDDWLLYRLRGEGEQFVEVPVGDRAAVPYDEVLKENTYTVMHWTHLQAGDTTSIKKSWEDATIYLVAVLVRQGERLTIH